MVELGVQLLLEVFLVFSILVEVVEVIVPLHLKDRQVVLVLSLSVT